MRWQLVPSNISIALDLISLSLRTNRNERDWQILAEVKHVDSCQCWQVVADEEIEEVLLLMLETVRRFQQNPYSVWLADSPEKYTRPASVRGPIQFTPACSSRLMPSARVTFRYSVEMQLRLNLISVSPNVAGMRKMTRHGNQLWHAVEFVRLD